MRLENMHIGKFYRCTSEELKEEVISECIDITRIKRDPKDYLSYKLRDITVLYAPSDFLNPDIWSISEDNNPYEILEVTKEQHPEYFL